jgi:hypothetical protein
MAKYLLSVMLQTCPIPAGIFGPSMVIGAALGRLLGEIYSYFVHVNSVASFALVGASAMTANITRTISICVVLFELTGQTEYMIPTFLATMISYGIGQLTTLGFFDNALANKKLPYLPLLKTPDFYQKTASDVSEHIEHLLSSTSTIKDGFLLLNRFTNVNKLSFIPVVDSRNNMLLTGAIQMNRLISYLRRMAEIENDVAKKKEVMDILAFVDELEFSEGQVTFGKISPSLNLICRNWL